MSAAEVLKIPLDGPNTDKPRNHKRVVVEVDVMPASGTCIAGRRLRQGVNRLEVYVDQLDELYGRLQTEKHLAALEQAREIARIKQDEWAKSTLKGVKDPAERQKRFDEECPYNEYTEVGLFPGMKTGVPPLKSIAFVRADGSTVDALEKLRPEDIEAEPLTPDNAPMRAADAQAQALMALVERLDRRHGNGGNRKG